MLHTLNLSSIMNHNILCYLYMALQFPHRQNTESTIYLNATTDLMFVNGYKNTSNLLPPIQHNIILGNFFDLISSYVNEHYSSYTFDGYSIVKTFMDTLPNITVINKTYTPSCRVICKLSDRFFSLWQIIKCTIYNSSGKKINIIIKVTSYYSYYVV